MHHKEFIRDCIYSETAFQNDSILCQFHKLYMFDLVCGIYQILPFVFKKALALAFVFFCFN